MTKKSTKTAKDRVGEFAKSSMKNKKVVGGVVVGLAVAGVAAYLISRNRRKNAETKT